MAVYLSFNEAGSPDKADVCRLCLLAFALVMVLCAGRLSAADDAPQFKPAGLSEDVGIDPRPGTELPLNVTFRNASSQQFTLRQAFNDRPVILMPVYYRCPMLCGLEFNGLVRAMRAMDETAGRDFTIVTFSIDPQETPDLASEKKAAVLRQYGREAAAAGWHFLTGSQGAVTRVCEAVGFRAERDERTGQYQHAAGIMVCTPEGKVSRYLYGVDFAPRDLKLALTEASAGEVSSLSDRILLFCYQYDPSRGQYGLAILNLVRGGGVLTVLIMGTAITVLLRRDRARQRSSDAYTSVDSPKASHQ